MKRKQQKKLKMVLPMRVRQVEKKREKKTPRMRQRKMVIRKTQKIKKAIKKMLEKMTEAREVGIQIDEAQDQIAPEIEKEQNPERDTRIARYEIDKEIISKNYRHIICKIMDYIHIIVCLKPMITVTRAKPLGW